MEPGVGGVGVNVGVAVEVTVGVLVFVRVAVEVFVGVRVFVGVAVNVGFGAACTSEGKGYAVRKINPAIRHAIINLNIRKSICLKFTLLLADMKLLFPNVCR
jgi:hypothetical protein